MSPNFEILLIEDNPGDIELIGESLRRSEYHWNLTVLNDGEAALTHIEQQRLIKHDLIMLDLNLPRIEGREVLRRLKLKSRFRETPTVVLSSSSDTSDITGVYNVNADCFITKPASLNDYLNTIQSVVGFYIRRKYSISEGAGDAAQTPRQ